MKYINANEILPDTLVKELQKYIQAGYLYIPADGDQHKSWGDYPAIGRNLPNAMRSLLQMPERCFD